MSDPETIRCHREEGAAAPTACWARPFTAVGA